MMFLHKQRLEGTEGAGVEVYEEMSQAKEAEREVAEPGQGSRIHGACSGGRVHLGGN